MTMSLCLLARHALRRGLNDHKRSITTSSGLRNMVKWCTIKANRFSRSVDVTW